MELCGKLAIVKSILDAEGASKLQNKDRGDHRFDLRALVDTWYVGFFQMLTENVSRDDVSNVFDNVSIITFNYDRCIERFLVQSLIDYCGISDVEAQALVSKLTIIHPYGKVGALPWQDRAGGVPFGSGSTDLLSTSRQIKTFTEGLDDEALLASIHSEVTAAETLVFLGFAFHPSNMTLLTPKTECNTKRIFATTLGLSKADEEVIEDDILKMIGKDDLPFSDAFAFRPVFANMTGGDFFKQYFRSLSAAIPLDQ